MTTAERLAVLASEQPLVDWAWIGRNSETIADRFVEHLVLTAYPMAFGIAIALPMALAAVRWPRLYTPMLGFTGLLFTIPSLALFVLLIAFTGLSRPTAIIPLTLYTLLVLVRNFVEGFRGVAPDVREAAAAMGYRAPGRTLGVELPLALPVMFAGIRIAVVTTVGLVAVAAMVGQGGLGQLMLDGFRRFFETPLLVGLVLSVLLAVGADLGLLALQRALTPWTRRAG